MIKNNHLFKSKIKERMNTFDVTPAGFRAGAPSEAEFTVNQSKKVRLKAKKKKDGTDGIDALDEVEPIEKMENWFADMKEYD